MEAKIIKCGDFVPKGYRGNYCPSCIKTMKEGK